MYNWTVVLSLTKYIIPLIFRLEEIWQHVSEAQSWQIRKGDLRFFSQTRDSFIIPCHCTTFTERHSTESTAALSVAYPDAQHSCHSKQFD